MLANVMRMLGQVLLLLFVACGAFLLWASFYVANCAALAVFFLSVAGAIALALR